MKFFKRDKNKNASCSNCKFRTATRDEYFCAKDVPSRINVRRLSDVGVRWNCAPLPEERICSDHQPV